MCPNIGECWETHRTATFLILGDVCTRACAYCNIATGRPLTLDLGEPDRVASAVERMGLRFAVITSVDRDDLPDGGASVFAAAIRRIRARLPSCGIEVLIPDFRGREDALSTVMAAQPSILNHNTETVPRLYRRWRPGGKYPWAMELLRRAKVMAPEGVTKSGLILGLGETHAEVLATMDDLRAVNCDVLTLGQYLQPPGHPPVERFYTPGEFDELKEQALSRGFKHVESGPMVRSSYHAHEQVPAKG
jgi:lipoic acid synthetase